MNRWYNKASVQTALVSGLCLIVVTALVQFSPKARLEKQVATLETQLAPFRALALDRFGGNEQQALAKLAAQLGELDTKLKQEAGRIRTFDITAVATLSGDWKSKTPPDFSHLFRTGGRASDIRAEIKTNDADMRWIDFADPGPPRMASGDSDTWVLDYTAHAPTGSWILGLNRDDLKECGTVEMVLYGIDENTATDGAVIVTDLMLSFYVNGVLAGRCEYRPNLRTHLTKEHGSPVRIQLRGPVPIEQNR